MEEINFCPFCDAGAHKIVSITDSLYYCKECDSFFTLKQEKLKCPKCSKSNITDSEFPMPDGQMVFQCKSCKKMFSAQEFLKFNNITNE